MKAWYYIIGIGTLIVGGFAGITSLDEYSRYDRLKRAGNPFAALVSNNYLLFGAVALIGIAAGVGFIILASQQQAKTFPVGHRSGDWIWDGTKWVAATEAAANPYSNMDWDGKRWVPKPEQAPTP